MIVSLDTNVLVSGALSSRTPPGKLLDLWRRDVFTLALSPWILAEARRTLYEPYFLRRLGRDMVENFLDLLAKEATIVESVAPVRGAATHPEDDMILAAAVSAHAAYLVTGDKHLQCIGAHGGVTILSPAAFLGLLEARPDLDK